MKKSILVVGAALMLAATAMAGTPGRTAEDKANNYFFPSTWNPAGRELNDVPQYVLYIWDDNGYSGAYGTEYNGEEYLRKYNQIAGTKQTLNDVGYNWETSDRIGGTNAPGAVFDAPQNWNTGVGTFENRDGIVENGGGQKIGLAWVLHELAKGGKTNSTPVPMTFNMITGLYVNVWGADWQDRESMYGYYVPSKEESGVANDADKHKKIPSVNVGRDMGIYKSVANSDGGPTQAQSNSIYRITQELKAAGMEFGNHTVDHMETNSRVPGNAAQFSVKTVPGYTDFWGDPSSLQYGFATENLNKTPWGINKEESREFGQDVGNTAQMRGWALYAGQFITAQTWKNAIKFGEDVLVMSPGAEGQNSRNGGGGMSANEIYGFRAPRLEVNSAMFYALADLEYLYECGLEEGYEAHRNGANYVWPYTNDNGIINSWTQYSNGERVFVDSMPAGLWQIPVNCVVVPEDIRPAVYANYRAIMAGAGTPVATNDEAAWLKSGKITAFDFNTWILWGMTEANWLKTMNNTLDLRINGNKAPFHYGCHTDYYTNNYDNGTLMTTFNRDGWGLPVVNGWNTYKNRQSGMEKFVIDARNKGAEFVTGRDLIVEMKKLVKEGLDNHWDNGTIELDDDWEFYQEDGSTANTSSTSIDNLSGSITIKPGEEYTGFAVDFDAGTLGNATKGATYISLKYKQTSASAIRLVLDDDDRTVREVTLAHRYPTRTQIDGFESDNNNYASAELRESGMIPLTAFDFPVNGDKPMNYSAIDVSKIIRIEIAPLAPVNRQAPNGQPLDEAWWNPENVSRKDDYEAKFEFKDFTIHTGTPFKYTSTLDIDPCITNPEACGLVGIVSDVKRNLKSNLSLAGMTANALRLNISKAGMYNVKIFSANGRMLQAFDSHSLTTGLNTLKLNNLAAGVYMIKVQGIDKTQQLTKSALVF